MKVLTLRAAKQDAEGALIVQRYATFEILTVGGQSGVDRVPGVVNGDGVEENPITANIAGLAKVGASDGDYDVLKTNPDGSTERETLTWFDERAARDVVVTARNETIQAQSDVADMAVQVEADADRADDARDEAENYAGIKPDAATGIAQTTSGQYFSVPSPNANEDLIRYRNNGGVAQEIKRTASAAAVTEAAQRIAPVTAGTGVFQSGQTGRGMLVYEISLDGSYRVPGGSVELSTSQIKGGTSSLSVEGITTDAVTIQLVDRLGSESVQALSKRGAILWEGGPGLAAMYVQLEGDDAAKYAQRNAANLILANRIYNTPISNLILPPWQMTYFLSDGQSESVSLEAYPPISRVQYDGNVCIGLTDYQYNSPDFDHFYPYGNNNLNPLISQSMKTNAGLAYTDAEMQAAGFAAGYSGETPIVGFANGIKRLRNRRSGLSADPNHVYGANSVGISGFAIGGLSKSSTRWARKVEAATRWKAIADAAGKTSGLGAMSFIQGIANLADQSVAGGGASYLSAMQQYWGDIKTDIVSGVFGQTDTPPLFIHATSGGGGVASEIAGIASAQIKFANDNPNEVICWGPKYMAPHKGVHLHPNGSRWWGSKMAQVYDHVVHGRKQWRPLQALSATARGKIVAVDMLVPVAPLKLAVPYYLSTSALRSDGGFAVYDDFGLIVVESLRIVLDTIVELTLRRAPIGTWRVVAGSTATGGYTNVCDSDPFVATDLYEYRSGAGMDPSTNISALNNKPYPMNNWMVPCNIVGVTL